MSLFDRDRIGASVFCEVLHGSKPRDEATAYGYVRWTHAKEGLVVSSLETVGRGRAKGPWIVQKVDIQPTA
ncbi:hypothetical protein LCGC14_0890860 [marine sediment metagenome]|uniref:Uncharacterized protein n=1 Tax=marine sediment metagenome TaxID=412755 RepID=A0A0F9RIN2_9ZZZZ